MPRSTSPDRKPKMPPLSDVRIKVFEPVTNEILTRADVANMRLPFHHGWQTWLVTDDRDRILGVYDSYQDALNHRHALAA